MGSLAKVKTPVDQKLWSTYLAAKADQQVAKENMEEYFTPAHCAVFDRATAAVSEALAACNAWRGN